MSTDPKLRDEWLAVLDQTTRGPRSMKALNILQDTTLKMLSQKIISADDFIFSQEIICTAKRLAANMEAA